MIFESIVHLESGHYVTEHTKTVISYSHQIKQKLNKISPSLKKQLMQAISRHPHLAEELNKISWASSL